jgi:DNA-binding SARP family transcriptional activator
MLALACGEEQNLPMRGRAASQLAWSLAAIALALFVAGNVLSVLASSPRGPHLSVTDRFAFAVFLTCAGVGALVGSRRPANPIGWLLLAEGLLLELGVFSIGYVHYALFARPGSLLAGRVVAWAGNSIWVPTLSTAAFVFLLFPTGRLRSRRWWPLVGVGLVFAAAAFASEAFAPGSFGGSLASVNNPLGIAGAGGVLSALGAIADALGGPLLIGAALLSFLLRFRTARGAERRQLRWLAYAAALVALSFTLGDVLQALGVPSSVYPLFFVLPLAALPIAVGIAVLRYRLYGIDVVIDRTVVVAGLAGFITCVYLAVLVGVGAAVGRGTGSNVVLAVVATAVVAVAFQPARARVQRLARRLAYGPPLPREEERGLAIRSLGAFRVFRDGLPVAATAWQSKKARTLLKILVARRGRSTPRDLLMEALWSEEDPAKLANRLSVALATVRGVLDPNKRHPADHFIVADKDSMRLELEYVAVDVEDFLTRAREGLALDREQRTEEAIAVLAQSEALYAGDFLEEDLYEDWASDLREEARATYIAVARRLAERSLEAGEHDAAVRYYLRILDKDFWDEKAHLHLVSALERAGRHGEARRRYRAYASRMGELDLPVSPFPA